MAEFTFRPATKEQSYGRIALDGPAGSGKTYTALRLATAMGQKIAVIDTEHGTARKYAHKFQFDVVELEKDFHPERYIQAIQAAEAAGYDVLVVDSISHEWSGPNGCLELVDIVAKRMRSGNKFAAWNEITPRHNRFMESMLGVKMHVIATMRSKTEYLQTEENGKKTIKKLGLAPVTRDGVEYEFDVVGDIDLNHDLVIAKTRCDELADTLWHKPGEDLAQVITDWLNTGEPMSEKPDAPVTKTPPPKAAKPRPPKAKSPKDQQPADPSPPPLTQAVADEHFKVVWNRINGGADPLDHNLITRCVAVSTNGKKLKECSPDQVDAVADALDAMYAAHQYGVSLGDIERAFVSVTDQPDWTADITRQAAEAVRRLVTANEPPKEADA